MKCFVGARGLKRSTFVLDSLSNRVANCICTILFFFFVFTLLTYFYFVVKYARKNLQNPIFLYFTSSVHLCFSPITTFLTQIDKFRLIKDVALAIYLKNFQSSNYNRTGEFSSLYFIIVFSSAFFFFFYFISVDVVASKPSTSNK